MGGSGPPARSTAAGSSGCGTSSPAEAGSDDDGARRPAGLATHNTAEGDHAMLTKKKPKTTKPSKLPIPRREQTAATLQVAKPKPVSKPAAKPAKAARAATPAAEAAKVEPVAEA